MLGLFVYDYFSYYRCYYKLAGRAKRICTINKTKIIFLRFKNVSRNANTYGCSRGQNYLE